MTKYALVVHSMFGQFLGVIGPFLDKQEAERWADKYTQHKINTVEAVEIMDPDKTVADMGLNA